MKNLAKFRCLGYDSEAVMFQKNLIEVGDFCANQWHSGPCLLNDEIHEVSIGLAQCVPWLRLRRRGHNAVRLRREESILAQLLFCQIGGLLQNPDQLLECFRRRFYCRETE
jgi:hypothetical protein